MVHWLSNGCQWNGAGTVHCNSCNHAMRITCKKKKDSIGNSFSVHILAIQGSIHHTVDDADP
jgi:hypothetical protein